jgi:SAM-dependent methyltransferase
MVRGHERLQVDEARWREAQGFESRVWASGNRHNGPLKLVQRLMLAALRPRQLARIVRLRDWSCGDDWNYWWLDAFDGYRALPRSLGSALEIGCGPYSNIRLIHRLVALDQMTCADPLMDDYLRYRGAWVANQARRGRIRAVSCKGESLPFEPSSYDLAVCINVLDHVQDAPRCLEEMHRVLRPGGYLVLGQDLTNADDYRHESVRINEGHPVTMEHDTLEGMLRDRYEPVFRRLLPREAVRAPLYHYGALVFIGRRR